MNRAARYQAQRRGRQRAKHGYIHAVLEVTSHPKLRAPFFAFLFDGAAMRVELKDAGELKLHRISAGLAGAEYRPLTPDEWPDQVCAYMAKRALTEGEIR